MPYAGTEKTRQSPLFCTSWISRSHLQTTMVFGLQIIAQSCNLPPAMQVFVHIFCMDFRLAQSALTVECLDIMLACTDLFAVAAPEGTQKSQEDETRIDSTPDGMLEDMMGLRLHEPAHQAISSPLRRVGDALQALLEMPTLAPLLALTLAIGGRETTHGDEGDSSSLRAAALRLLRVALHLPKFSITA